MNTDELREFARILRQGLDVLEVEVAPVLLGETILHGEWLQVHVPGPGREAAENLAIAIQTKLGSRVQFALLAIPRHVDMVHRVQVQDVSVRYTRSKNFIHEEWIQRLDVVVRAAP